MKCILPVILVIAGCGSTTERQEHRTLVETVDVPAFKVETPAATFVTSPVKIIRKVQELREGTEKKTLDLPKPDEVIGPLIAGSPWGGIISAIAGFGTAAFAVKKQIDGKTLNRKLVKAQSDYADDLEDAETDEDVAAVKAKHAEKQKALGIHEDLTKARHT